jgi:hypothetical protein
MERLGRKGVAVYRSATCEDIISVGNYLENKNEEDWGPLARGLREAVVEESITSRLRRIFRRVYSSEVSVFP